MAGSWISGRSRSAATMMCTSSPYHPGSGRRVLPLTTSASSCLRLSWSPVLLMVHARTTPSGVPTYARCMRLARPSHTSNHHCFSFLGPLVMSMTLSQSSAAAMSDFVLATRSYCVRPSGLI